MEGSVAQIGSGEIHYDVASTNLKSKLERYAFVLPLILGVGALAVVGVGIAGCLQVGVLSHLGQVGSISMITGGGAALPLAFLAVGLVVKNRPRDKGRMQNQDTEMKTLRSPASQTECVENKRADKQDRLVYGPAAWKIWEVEILDEVPEMPEVDWEERDPYFKEPFRKNYVLLYIPKKVRVQKEEKSLCLNSLVEICGEDHFSYSRTVRDQIGNETAPGWVLISKKFIPESRNKTYNQQQISVPSGSILFSLPKSLEAAVLNLMVRTHNKGEELYSDDPSYYTRCKEKVDVIYPVLVGYSTSSQIHLGYDIAVLRNKASECYGVLAVLRYSEDI